MSSKEHNLRVIENILKIGSLEGEAEAKDKKEREEELMSHRILEHNSTDILCPSDIHRIVSHTDRSIITSPECVLWKGYIANRNKQEKGMYINFYFKNRKKVPLHRLLYKNYVGDIKPGEYVKYMCSNKGMCCNVNHMSKSKYKRKERAKPPEKKTDVTQTHTKNLELF